MFLAMVFALAVAQAHAADRIASQCRKPAAGVELEIIKARPR